MLEAGFKLVCFQNQPCFCYSQASPPHISQDNVWCCHLLCDFELVTRNLKQEETWEM